MLKIIGINDEVTTCECCGKSNLKCTVVLTNGEGEFHYGRDCAARATAVPFCRPRSATKIEREARERQAGNYREPIRQPFFFPNGKRFA